MADFQIRARLTATDDGASATAAKVGNSFTRVASEIRSRFVITAGDVVNAFRAIGGAFTAGIRAAAEAEANTNRLRTALADLGPASSTVTNDLVQYATELSKVTTASDDAIVSGQALLASFTSSPEKIKLATKAALDLSAATGLELQTAFRLLGQAAQGNTDTLARYGIRIDDTVPKAEKFQAVLAKVNEQFGGQAQAAVDTYGGKVQSLSNQFGNFQEAFGSFVTRSTAGKVVLDLLSTATEFYTEKVEAASAAVNGQGEVSEEAAAKARALEVIHRAQAEAAAALAEKENLLKLTLEELGLKTLPQVAAESARLREQKVQLREAFESGRISVEAYRAGLEAVDAALVSVGDKVAQANARIAENAAEAIAEQEALAESFRETTEASDDLVESVERQGEAAVKAANGWLTLNGARDGRTDVEIAQQNLDAFDALSGFRGAGRGIGERQGLLRRLQAAREAEGGSAGVTVPVGGQAATFGILGGGTRSARGVRR